MKKLWTWIGLATVAASTGAAATSTFSPKAAAPFIIAGGALAAVGESVVKVEQAVKQAKARGKK